MSDHMDLLRRSDVFAGLSDAQLAKLTGLAHQTNFEEGEILLAEDERGGRFFLVTKGRVEIEVRAPFEGRAPQVLATIKAGEVLGELSLVDGFLRSATGRALEPVEALAFENKDVLELMADDTAIGYRVMRNLGAQLAQRIRTTNMKLRNALGDTFYY
jgi:CRP-like cAMP-binding protein